MGLWKQKKADVDLCAIVISCIVPAENEAEDGAGWESVLI